MRARACVCVCVRVYVCVCVRSYHTWHLEASQLPPAHMEQVVLGIKEHRETLSGPVRQPVNVCVSNQDTATRLRGLLGNSEQVTVAGE